MTRDDRQLIGWGVMAFAGLGLYAIIEKPLGRLLDAIARPILESPTLHIAFTVFCITLWAAFWRWYINRPDSDDRREGSNQDPSRDL